MSSARPRPVPGTKRRAARSRSPPLPAISSSATARAPKRAKPMTPDSSDPPSSSSPRDVDVWDPEPDDGRLPTPALDSEAGDDDAASSRSTTPASFADNDAASSRSATPVSFADDDNNDVDADGANSRTATAASLGDSDENDDDAAPGSSLENAVDETDDFVLREEVVNGDIIAREEGTGKVLRQLTDFVIHKIDDLNARAPYMHTGLEELAVQVSGRVLPLYGDENFRDDDDDGDDEPVPVYLTTLPIMRSFSDMDKDNRMDFWVETHCAWYRLTDPHRSYADQFWESAMINLAVEFVLDVLLDDPDKSMKDAQIWDRLINHQFGLGGKVYAIEAWALDHLKDQIRQTTVEWMGAGKITYRHPVLDRWFKEATGRSRSRNGRTSRASGHDRAPRVQQVQKRTPHLKKDALATFTPLVAEIADEFGVYQVGRQVVGSKDVFTYSRMPEAIVKPSDAPIVAGDTVRTRGSAANARRFMVHSVDGNRAHVVIMLYGYQTQMGAMAEHEFMYPIAECRTVPLADLQHDPQPVRAMFLRDRFVKLDLTVCPGCQRGRMPVALPDVVELERTHRHPLLTRAGVATFPPLNTTTIRNIEVGGVKYFENDFIYYDHDKASIGLYLFAQIVKISSGNQPSSNGVDAMDVSNDDDDEENDVKSVPARGRAAAAVPRGRNGRATTPAPPKRSSSSRAARASVKVRLLGRWNSLYHDDNPDADSDPRRVFMTNIYETIPVDKLRGHLVVVPRGLESPNKYFQFEHNLVLHGLHPSHNPTKFLEHMSTSPTKLRDSVDPAKLEPWTTDVFENRSVGNILKLNEQAALLNFTETPADSLEDVVAAADPTAKPRGLARLKAIDLFSGCGGLTVGFDSDLVACADTKWAIEWDEHASLTFHSNFPGSTVYNVDCNALLEDAIKQRIATFGTDAPPPVTPAEITKSTKVAPDARNVDFIYCGPPCQGFSGLNNNRKSDDPKNALIATALSYVELYRPKVFLLENVVGLLTFKFGGQQATKHRVEGGHKTGTLSFILRVLVELGYQVTWHVAQAGNYGTPQSRRRVLVFATLPHIKLPDWPEPTHIFKTETCNLAVCLDAEARAAAKARLVHHVTSYCKVTRALYPNTTVKDAISDLPAFDFENPNVAMKLPRNKVEAMRHNSAVKLVKGYEPTLRFLTEVGYTRPAPYLTRPRSHYQRLMRRVATRFGRMRLDHETEAQQRRANGADAHGRDADNNDEENDEESDESDLYLSMVKNQMTRQFTSSDIVERICWIPRDPPGCDHQSLPDELKPWALSHEDSAASRHSGWKGLYGRLQWEGTFKTATTEMNPMGKTGTILHPEQDRIITVREAARSQGFPDNFTFHCYGNAIKLMYFQVGNAVPPVLAAALNRSLVRALAASPLHVLTEEEAALVEQQQQQEEE
ncbi:DNA (cytosine-5-)-methyltransferase [Allomyces macrogynus ATCC 38327]|uniref:Cytosine-specific methyltransferase n=1 Tax=Allomyces macrogynus (strain ATCC 38327) TaxID=578462 RepID=A0A0L0SFW9_ALLM3|nr:DNA (cytosine-5-)-methyltransferase [Allomyces macrogynus ATCC 38327]|eukprot:KNE61408.1 DNA (cytosine-5-)-methyltransferase [Allomyces macrogynus ATCC 38327]